MASFTAAFMTRQLACSAKPALRFPLALPSTQYRTFTATPRTSASVNADDDLAEPPQQAPKQGSLNKGSIFADEEDEVWQAPTTSGAKPRNASGEDTPVQRLPLAKRDRASIDAMLDPEPARRAKMERKLVIRAIQKRGRLTKTEEVLYTERESLCKSAFFKTSVKKLTPLARQIAGKTVDDALLQMKFSVKKAAKDVKSHLEYARDRATVMNGMGLGKVTGETAADAKPVTIVMKNGRKRTITDPTNMYVAQAWVNRGPFGKEPDFRARGQVYMMRPPHTGLTVLLKEEKTLI
ncbi:hypothetical protein KEM56_002657, partial [Ascosphaera pollenicola]